MASSLDLAVKRFIKAVKDGDDVRKLHSIVSAIPKNDLMSWVDGHNQDVLHYAIMCGNTEAVDFLLKMGFFAVPYEPEINMYAHLAARLGFRAVLCTILKHRPEDFKLAQQPLIISPELGCQGLSTLSNKKSGKEPELVMPAVIGSQVFTDGKASKETGSIAMSSHLSQLGLKRFSQTPSTAKLSFPTRSLRLSVTEGGIINPRQRSERNSIDKKIDSRFDDNGFQEGMLRLGNTSTFRQEFRHDSLIASQPKMLLTEKRRFSSPDDSGCFSVKTVNSSKLKPLHLTPLDVAARSKHVGCVMALLDMFILRAHPDIGCKGYLTLSALANNVPSLKLMMEPYASGTNDHNVREDYRSAVQVCVHNIYAECLELLLNNELVDSRTIFKMINYFHVMYSQPLNTHLRIVSLARFPMMTEHLISRGHEVNVKIPPRTYPLYSLIDNAFTCMDYSCAEYIITTMKILMERGADPNFDEVEYERQLSPSVGSRHYGGRSAYSSALHCVIQSLERNHDCYASKAPAIRFVEDCMPTLTAYGANIEKMGCIDVDNPQMRGDVLWQFARSSVGLGLDRGLLHCLTRFGSQPQRRIDGQFALNVYLDTFCGLMKKDPANAQSILIKRERDLGLMITHMCSFMAPWHIKAVWDIFNYRHKKCTTDVHELFKRMVNEALEAQSQLIHKLRHMCAWQVWKLCSRKAYNVRRLPVSKELKTHVLPLVLNYSMF
ncbi:hypothetical protein ACOMHN_046360 [Nucella lapillus]